MIAYLNFKNSNFLMRKIKFHKTFILIILFIANKSISQNIITKDGVSLGKRSEFISSCMKSANQEMIKFNGMEIQASKYCACVSDNLIPTLNSWEIKKAVRENKMKDLFLKDGNFEIIMKCAEGNVTFNEDFKVGESGDIEFQKKAWIKNCRNEIIKNDSEKIWNLENAENACNCMVNKLFSEGSSYNELKEIIDVNSPIFNEVALPCVVKAFDKKNAGSNSYNINDIKGGGFMSEVKLIDYFGNGFKVKIKIGNVTKYFLFDTGSTDLTIDQDTERELLLDGYLKRENYLNKSQFELADNKTVTGQKIRLNDIKIGDYTVNNVVLTIINQGSLLCGKSFLDKFRNWELDKKNNLLILYK